jgi:hypothetical protein
LVIVARPDLRPAAERIGAAVWRSARKSACHGLAQNLRAREYCEGRNDFGPAASPRLWRCSGMRNRSLGRARLDVPGQLVLARLMGGEQVPHPSGASAGGAHPEGWDAAIFLISRHCDSVNVGGRPPWYLGHSGAEPVGVEVADHIAGPVVAGEGDQRARGPRPCPELTAAQT